MSKQKPVWRMNTGRGVPSDLGSDFIFGDGEPKGRSPLAVSCVWDLKGDMMDIIAYQTTRTKAPKFERVECDCCLCTGNELGIEVESGGIIQYGTKCPHCNGKSYRLEAVK